MNTKYYLKVSYPKVIFGIFYIAFVIDAYFLNANNNGKNCEIHNFLLSLPVELKVEL